jgi:hypothetical protein
VAKGRAPVTSIMRVITWYRTKDKIEFQVILENRKRCLTQTFKVSTYHVAYATGPLDRMYEPTYCLSYFQYIEVSDNLCGDTPTRPSSRMFSSCPARQLLPFLGPQYATGPQYGGPEKGRCVSGLVRRTAALKRVVAYCGPKKGSSCLVGQDENVLEDGLVGVSPHLHCCASDAVWYTCR